jgi:uncharacterized paraquat-inducible protein A
MTIHDRYLVDVRDLRVMRFECKKCGTSVGYPSANLATVPTECSGCGMTWTAVDRESYQMLTSLATGLRHAIAVADDEETGYRLRFEIERPK